MIKFIFEKNLKKEELKEHIYNHQQILNIGHEDVDFFEGYEYRNNDYSKPIYGASTVGRTDYFTLYHEISHGIEIIDEDPERVLLPRFGMSTKSQLDVGGILYDQPISYQGCERECRVFAIQAHLMAHIFKFNPKKVLSYMLESGVTALEYSSDFLSIPTPEELEYSKKNDYRINVLKDLTTDYFNNYNINDILEKQSKVSKIRDYQNFNNLELEKLAFHNVSIEELLKYKDPLNAWIELESPITEKEIYHCLALNNEELTNTPLWSDNNFNKANSRENHIRKIAYFIKNKYNNPIDIEVNIEGNGHEILWINDGNHRFAAEYLREKNSDLIHNHTIKANISGDINRAKKMYLWGPNIFMMELHYRFKKEFETSMEKNVNHFYKKIKSNNHLQQEDLIKLDEINIYLNNRDTNCLNKEELFIKNIKIDWENVDFKTKKYPIQKKQQTNKKLKPI